MRTIHEQENLLFQEWEEAFIQNGDKDFCQDGLIHNGQISNSGKSQSSGNEEALWQQAKRKIVFFMKEPNSNPDEDYRAWGVDGECKSIFFKTICSWLKGLSTLQKEGAYSLPLEIVFNKEIPFVLVNAKKQSGGSTADENEVYSHATRYASFLRRQMDIYSPNIIVCGSQTPFNIMKDIIYTDIAFEKMADNNWIYYNKDKKIVLIHSWHPSSRKSYEEKIDDLHKYFQQFLKADIFEI